MPMLSIIQRKRQCFTGIRHTTTELTGGIIRARPCWSTWQNHSGSLRRCCKRLQRPATSSCLHPKVCYQSGNPLPCYHNHQPEPQGGLDTFGKLAALTRGNRISKKIDRRPLKMTCILGQCFTDLSFGYFSTQPYMSWKVWTPHPLPSGVAQANDHVQIHQLQIP